jgi:non-specific protein-tyrosine kinase
MDEVQVSIDALGTPESAEVQAEQARLQTLLAGYRNTYATLVQSYETIRLVANQSGNSVFVFEPAEVPRYPLSSGRMRSTLLAMLVGAAVGLGIGFLVEFLDDTIKTPDDVQEVLGLDTLGIIGQMRRADKELIVPDLPRSPVTESYRGLRTNIRFSSVDNPLHTLLVTSANATEGKSVTVANLAASMAEADLKVVAIDADLRRPRLHELFDMNRTGGLTQALLDGRVDGNVQPALYMGRLGVLSAGELPPNPAELLGSRRMRDLLEQIEAQCDMILIDSPPINPVTDAAVLAQSVDGVLLVVDAGRTRKGAARRAVETMRQVGANIVGVVLNAVPVKRGGYYYYYYYHGEYGADGTRRVRKRGMNLVDRLTEALNGKPARSRRRSSPSKKPTTGGGLGRASHRPRTH